MGNQVIVILFNSQFGVQDCVPGPFDPLKRSIASMFRVHACFSPNILKIFSPLTCALRSIKNEAITSINAAVIPKADAAIPFLNLDFIFHLNKGSNKGTIFVPMK